MVEEAEKEEGEEEEDRETKGAAKKPESVPKGNSKGKKGSTNARWAAPAKSARLCEERSMILDH